MLFGALTLGYIFLIINLVYLSYIGRKYKLIFYGFSLIILALITSYLMIMVNQFTGNVATIITVYQNLFLFTLAMGTLMYLVYILWTMIYLLLKVTYDLVWVKWRKILREKR